MSQRVSPLSAMKVVSYEPKPNKDGIVQHLPIWRTCLSAKVLAGYCLCDDTLTEG